MPVKRSLNIVLFSGLAFVYVCGAVGFLLYLQGEYEQDMTTVASRQMDIARAVRQFTTEHVRGVLRNDESEFHPASVHSFAAVRTMQLLQMLHPGQRYREVALNPMNLDNKAYGWEVRAIEEFRTNGKAEFASVTEDGSAMYFARPIVVSSTACLACHGNPQSAPSTLRARYGGVNGFGWKLGEVIGAQVVTAPTGDAKMRRNRSLIYYLGASLLVLVGGFVALRLGLRKGVVEPIQSAGNAWRKLASEDALTGAASRRSVLDMLDLLTSTEACGSAMSVIFVDIDHFKLVNDTHGHLAGDQILREITQRIRSATRDVDVIGRYGGEELLVVLPACKRKDAVAKAGYLRHVIASTPFTMLGMDGIRWEVAITASLGVAEWLPGETVEHLLSRADAAMYRAKSGGRNAVDVAQEHEDFGVDRTLKMP